MQHNMRMSLLIALLVVAPLFLSVTGAITSTLYTVSSPTYVTFDSRFNTIYPTLFITQPASIMQLAIITNTNAEEEQYRGMAAALQTLNLTRPMGIAVDPVHNFLYVVDNNRVLQLQLSTFVLTGTWTGQVFNPQGIVASRNTGNVYVSDAGNHRVVVFNTSGVVVNVFTVLNPSLNTVTGIALDESGGVNLLYVVDTGGSNNRIVVFNAATGANTAMIQSPTVTPWNNPNGLAIDGLHRLYLADTGNRRVIMMSVTTGLAVMTYTNLTGLPSNVNGSLVAPLSVAVNSAGSMVVVTDTTMNRVAIFSQPVSSSAAIRSSSSTSSIRRSSSSTSSVRRSSSSTSSIRRSSSSTSSIRRSSSSTSSLRRSSSSTSSLRSSSTSSLRSSSSMTAPTSANATRVTSSTSSNGTRAVTATSANASHVTSSTSSPANKTVNVTCENVFGFNLLNLFPNLMTLSLSVSEVYYLQVCGLANFRNLCDPAEPTMMCQYKTPVATNLATYVPAAVQWTALTNGIQMTQSTGAVCKATQSPITLNVQFLCNKNYAKGTLAMFSHPSACQYSAVVYSSGLCSTGQFLDVAEDDGTTGGYMVVDGEVERTHEEGINIINGEE